VKYQWVRDHTGPGAQPGWTVARVCRVLEVSRSGYYDWKCRPASARAVRARQLLEEIRLEHAQSRGAYGAPRVHQGLLARGIEVCLNTVAALMRQARIRSVRARRFVPRTTDARHDYAVAGNVLDRDFVADKPNQKWLCDITYLPTNEGYLYLASVLDVCTRRVVGWQIANHLRAELCLDALEMALESRRPGHDLLHHSDRGVQYACDAYQRVLAEQRIVCSMSRTGNCYDNAMMESFHASLKTELVYPLPGGRFATADQARLSVFEWIEVFYNRQRRHSAIGYVSPVMYEASLN
jgi:putative transposase